MVARVNTFGRNTNLVETRDFANIITEIANTPNQSAFFCNVHMLMLSQEDKALADAMDTADWVFADGVPVAWLQSKISGKDAKVVRGHELMLTICERAARTGEKVGFLGSTGHVMECLVAKLCERLKGLSVAYQYCPPFVKGELISTSEELQAIRDSQVKWLFVGLGCPKQEKWIATHKDVLDCNILGVGAAFDWLSGLTSMPPHWMEKLGLAWFYRLLHNPVKMWRRYFIYNSKFIVKVCGMLAGRK